MQTLHLPRDCSSCGAMFLQQCPACGQHHNSVAAPQATGIHCWLDPSDPPFFSPCYAALPAICLTSALRSWLLKICKKMLLVCLPTGLRTCADPCTAWGHEHNICVYLEECAYLACHNNYESTIPLIQFLNYTMPCFALPATFVLCIDPDTIVLPPSNPY